MIYLKTYFYVEHEIKFLKMNLEESYDYIDKFIICEFNRTHTGMPRKFLNKDEIIKTLPQDKIDKVLYLQCDISKMTVEAYNNEQAIHSINEPVMRSAFMKLVDIKDEDIVISVDADEIIYRDSYKEILSGVEKENCIKINLNQFFYKINYLWENKDFIAPTAAKYKVFKNNFPCNWRYQGKLLDGKHGCHFSWCMTPEEMIYKLNTYSHPRYRNCANKKLLEDSIKNKIYPFDKKVEFKIKELPRNHIIMPKCLREECE